MTRLEATEIILEGKPYADCHCSSGDGARHSPDCDKCYGWGLYIRSDYLRACEIVGIPSPPSAWDLKLEDLNRQSSGFAEMFILEDEYDQQRRS